MKKGDKVYVESYTRSGILMYKGLATITSSHGMEIGDSVVVKFPNGDSRYVYLNGTDGDLIRPATKLELVLDGE